MMIDLKNCEVFLTDGTRFTGAIDNVAGYPIGTTTVVVDGVVGKIPVGARLKFGTDITVYKVISTIETTLNTTTIVFSPGLVVAVADADPLVAGPLFLKIKVGEGNITYSETKNREYKLDRGLISEVRNGDEAPMDINLQLWWEELTASDPLTDPPTPEDVLKKRGAAATWKTSDNQSADTNCRPYAVNIEILHSPPCTDKKKELVILPFYRYEKLDHDPKAGTLSTTGKCNASEAIVTRVPWTN